MKDLINYSSEELVGKSLYDYHHALDSDVVESAYKDCKLSNIIGTLLCCSVKIKQYKLVCT